MTLQRAFGFALKRRLGLARWGSSLSRKVRLGNLVTLAARTAQQQHYIHTYCTYFNTFNHTAAV
jgi:hypothetical protein